MANTRQYIDRVQVGENTYYINADQFNGLTVNEFVKEGKFVEAVGLHNLFDGEDFSHLKENLELASEDSIIFIVADTTDTTNIGRPYVSGTLWVWKNGILRSGNNDVTAVDATENTGSGTVAPIVLNGKSAYEIAVLHGFVGTEDEWLASLKGASGSNGTDGDDISASWNSETYILTIYRNGVKQEDIDLSALINQAAGNDVTYTNDVKLDTVISDGKRYLVLLGKRNDSTEYTEINRIELIDEDNDTVTSINYNLTDNSLSWSETNKGTVTQNKTINLRKYKLTTYEDRLYLKYENGGQDVTVNSVLITDEKTTKLGHYKPTSNNLVATTGADETIKLYPISEIVTKSDGKLYYVTSLANYIVVDSRGHIVYTHYDKMSEEEVPDPDVSDLSWLIFNVSNEDAKLLGITSGGAIAVPYQLIDEYNRHSTIKNGDIYKNYKGGDYSKLGLELYCKPIVIKNLILGVQTALSSTTWGVNWMSGNDAFTYLKKRYGELNTVTGQEYLNSTFAEQIIGIDRRNEFSLQNRNFVLYAETGTGSQDLYTTNRVSRHCTCMRDRYKNKILYYYDVDPVIRVSDYAESTLSLGERKNYAKINLASDSFVHRGFFGLKGNLSYNYYNSGFILVQSGIFPDEKIWNPGLDRDDISSITNGTVDNYNAHQEGTATGDYNTVIKSKWWELVGVLNTVRNLYKTDLINANHDDECVINDGTN